MVTFGCSAHGFTISAAAVFFFFFTVCLLSQWNSLKAHSGLLLVVGENCAFSLRHGGYVVIFTLMWVHLTVCFVQFDQSTFVI